MRSLVLVSLFSCISLFGGELEALTLNELEARAAQSSRQLSQNPKSISELRKAFKDRLKVAMYHLRINQRGFATPEDDDRFFAQLDLAEAHIQAAVKIVPQTNENRKVESELYWELIDNTQWSVYSKGGNEKEIAKKLRYFEQCSALLEANFRDAPHSEKAIVEYGQLLDYWMTDMRLFPNHHDFKSMIRVGKQAVKVWKDYESIADNQAFAARRVGWSLQQLAVVMIKSAPREELSDAFSHARESIAIGEEWLRKRNADWDGWNLGATMSELARLLLARAETDKNEEIRSKANEWLTRAIDLQKTYPKPPDPPGD